MLVNRTQLVCLSISAEILAKLLRCWRRQHYAAEKSLTKSWGHPGAADPPQPLCDPGEEQAFDGRVNLENLCCGEATVPVRVTLKTDAFSPTCVLVAAW